MSILLFANIATTTLAGAITAGATTANLAAGSGGLFPQPGSNQYFTMTFVDAATGLINEVVYVTAMSGDQITAMTRGREGTTARAWNAGDRASNYWTAGNAAAMIQVGQLQQQATNYAQDTGAANGIVVSVTPAPGNLAAMNGAPLRIRVKTNNTGGTTINLNGFGAVPLLNLSVSNVLGGQLLANTIIEVVYDTAANVFWLLSNAPDITSTAVGGVLSGNLPNPGFAANPAFTGNVSATGTVYGALLETTPTGSINIGNGASGIGGALTVDGTFTGVANSSFSSNLTIAGSLGVETNLSVLGEFTMPGGITIYQGNISAPDGTVYAEVLATTAAGYISVGTGASGIGGTLYVTGAFTAGGSATIDGSLTITSNGLSGVWECQVPTGGSTAALESNIGIVGGQTTVTVASGWAYGGDGAAAQPSSTTGSFGLITGYACTSSGFYSASDIRLKDDRREISPDEGLAFVGAVHPMAWTWKSEAERGRLGTGYIAQQLLAAGYEHLVFSLPHKADVLEEETHTFGEQTITSQAGVKLAAKYDDTIPYLHAALRGALDLIARLEGRIAQLEARPAL